MGAKAPLRKLRASTLKSGVPDSRFLLLFSGKCVISYWFVPAILMQHLSQETLLGFLNPIPQTANRRMPTRFKIPAVLLLALTSILAATMPASPAQIPETEHRQAQVRTEIPYQDGTVTLLSDSQESIAKTRYRAKGRVQITFQDFMVYGDDAQYDTETRDGFITGNVRFIQKQQWLSCSKAEFNFGTHTGVFYDASGFTDRQFLISGRTVRRTGPDTYQVEDGLITACLEDQPKWSFSASRTNLRVDHTARMHSTTFKIKGIPVFYFPYVVMPLEKKRRSSGLVPFHTGNSTSKGRVVSEGWYQTLGKSADVLIYGDYFTMRGLALGGLLRARPNPETRFDLQVYGIRDKMDQGGVLLGVDGESWLRDDWRAVARVNITSNFSFRQAFAETFRSATVPLEKATAFLTRNHNSVSTNIAFERQEVVFPIHSLVVRKLPSLEFISLATPFGNSPFILSYRTSLEGVSRLDSTMKTPQLIQRLDFFPSLTIRLPSILGFSMVPTVGVRETYYGAQISEDSETGISNRGLHRRYADFGVDLRTPVIDGSFSAPWLGKMQHLVEPFATYRWTGGIDNFDKIIRFDEQDAIANTNEIEYGIVNRFYRRNSTSGGAEGNHEFMSLGLVQKYYFDPTFDGAFRIGQSNAFYPLDSVTGFYQTGIPSTLAPLSAIFQLSPRAGIHNDVRVDYDTRRHRWRNGSLSALWQQGKVLISGTYVRTNMQDARVPSSNHVQGQIGFSSPDLRGFSAGLTVSYNLKTRQMLNSNTRANYTWDCCGVAMEFNQFDLGLRTESRLSFSFTLKGIGSFGNLKRPESIF
jgi:LPS-assembly protein